MEQFLGDGPPKAAVEKAKTALKEGEELVAHRQKLIKVADHSEFGWAVVAEYEADALAADADDERRLERAEKAAERKIVAKCKKLEAGSQSKKMALGATGSDRGVSKRPTKSGVFFGCGEPGHFRKDCPKGTTTPVMYPLQLNDLYECAEGWDFDNDAVDEHMGRCWDSSQGEYIPVDGVKGRLSEHVSYWIEQLKAPKWIIDVIKEGYVLPLLTEPTVYRKANQKSALNNIEFVDNAVSDLVQGGYVEPVVSIPHVCSPLSVVENSSGKKRLVINLRHGSRSLSMKICVLQ